MWMCQPKKFMFGWYEALEQGGKPNKQLSLVCCRSAWRRSSMQLVIMGWKT